MTDLKICVGSACHLKGSNDVIEIFKYCVQSRGVLDKVTIKAAFCLGHCTEAVSVSYNDKIYSINIENAEKFFDDVVMKTIRS
ncbi:MULTISPECIES: NAD(P)H-dependent oxidoreductase subunit E [Sedimentibacter]|uniref:NAD(P)H-dependent oxidoreductase subunit E n=1 Tax=Sedimentibacter hydroxybenzoicus DSM 7310 TaxID=1123245 RepID=A0A974GX21_SEDHY|nr:MULTISPECIES: NAD(P)H-dependent oxidoreductase subunit E [Sedimentibacter]NYB75099.1 NAD(P)H-dependent oxidoreductase subunit E [Sedimentibacter hydroxybenzoicus DSM 7310]